MAGLVLVTAACGGQSASGSPSAKATTTWTSSPGPSTYSYGSGLGFYDGKFSPKSIETTAKWLGSASSVKFAQDFIDASSWSKIATPWPLPKRRGRPCAVGGGGPVVPC